MSNITFSQLPDIGNGIINGAIIPIVQNGVNYTVTAQEIGNYIAVVNPSNYGNSNVAAFLPTYTGNISAGNIGVAANVTVGNITAVGNIAGQFFIGNGSLLTGIAGGGNYSNANVAAYLPTYTGNILSGNISVIGNTVSIGNIDTGNLRTVGLASATGNVTGGNITTAGLVTATGNIQGGNIRTVGLITATGNITGGNITTAGLITATGNITGGNINTAGRVSATGNIVGNVFLGNGSQLTGITATTISSGTSNVQFSGSGGNILLNAGGQAVGNIGQNNVYIGYLTGRTPAGVQTIGIGYQAGQSAQGSGAIAIGLQAGQSAQGAYSVAVGTNAGSTNQGSAAVALGQEAGQTNQGANAVAIGFGAASINQSDSSIIINATGAILDDAGASTVVIKPMRGDTITNLTAAGFTGVYYNATTGELCYSTGA